MQLDWDTCEAARLSRDSRFDGRFFIGVKTTGIYCRSVCPAPSPRSTNVQYFQTAAAAAEAGLRPCLRCRPEASPGTPAWMGSSATVSRALRLIDEGRLEDQSMDDLAGRLGIGARQLRRLFLQHLGATPIAVVQTRRTHFAKSLIDQTELPFSEVALASGFGSVRRFNTCFQKMYGRTPTQLRKAAPKHAAGERGRYTFRLAFRPPLDWPAMLDYLAPRAIPGVEAIAQGCYRRTISVESKAGFFEARLSSKGNALDVAINFPDARPLFLIVERIRRLFDLRADPLAIYSGLTGLTNLNPGLRVPGTWDGFELAVRAILGQQITVKGATTLAGRLVCAYGQPVDFGNGLTHLFPAAQTMATEDLAPVGLTRSRIKTLQGLAQAIASGEIEFTHAMGTEGFLDKLRALPGVGEWTVQYIAMRALAEPDAFPASDLGLLRASGLSPKQLLERAAGWRPWRAYAAMQLWCNPTKKDEDVLQIHGQPNGTVTSRKQRRESDVPALLRRADAGPPAPTGVAREPGAVSRGGASA